MQWLIDIIAQRVIETIGIPPCYVDRGDPDTWDFETGDFTCDGNYHELDLSSIVPAGAQAIAARLSFKHLDAEYAGIFRKKGRQYAINCSVHNTTASLIAIANDIIVEIDEDRKVEYRFGANPVFIRFVVKGWWM